MINAEDFLDHQPLTEEQALGLLEKGDYEAWVRIVEIKTAQSGVKYFVFTMDVYDKNGNPHTIIDWMTLPYKIKHFYEATGMEDKYQSYKLNPADCVGKNVGVRIGIQKASEKNPRTRNQIYDYIKLKHDDVSHNPVGNINHFDDPLTL